MKILLSLSFLILLFSCAHTNKQVGELKTPKASVEKKSKGAKGKARVSKGNSTIMTFSEAKKFLPSIHEKNPYTIYCHCRYEEKAIDLQSCGYSPKNDPERARRLEWEHVVPAENFGRSFVEWRKGAPECSGRGRKCARKNPNFNLMEADLYNLWPEVGELNGLRSNFNMAEISGEGQFGECKAKIESRKFEPMDFAKGRVARVYMYMNEAYPQADIISDKNEKLFQAWDRMYPVDAWECERARKIKEIQGNTNEILETRCAQAGL